MYVQLYIHKNKNIWTKIKPQKHTTPDANPDELMNVTNNLSHHKMQTYRYISCQKLDPSQWEST